MRIIATPMIARDLEPGDLFSTYGPAYWNAINDFSSIGERVYIRTNAPAFDAPDPEITIYRITIETTKESSQ